MLTPLPYRAVILTNTDRLEGVGDFALHSAAESAMRTALSPSGDSDITVQQVTDNQWVVMTGPSSVVSGLITKQE